MVIKYPEYNIFEAGETWELIKDESFIFEVTVTFKAGSYVEIISIEEEGVYGKAEIKIENRTFYLGLDELYDMVYE